MRVQAVLVVPAAAVGCRVPEVRADAGFPGPTAVMTGADHMLALVVATLPIVAVVLISLPWLGWRGRSRVLLVLGIVPLSLGLIPWRLGAIISLPISIALSRISVAWRIWLGW